MEQEFTFKEDVDNKILRYGSKTFEQFKLLDRVEDVYSVMDFSLIDSSIQMQTKHRNPRARAFSDKYKITPAKFMKVFNAKMLKMWVEPIKEHVNRFAYTSKRKLKQHVVKNIWKNLGKIEQAKKDGTYNIVPWIIEKGMNTQQLKQELGKGLWKKLCSQSMTRNKFLTSVKGIQTEFHGNLHIAVDFPSYLLKRGGNTYWGWSEATKWLVDNRLLRSEHFKIDSVPPRDIRTWEHIYCDTRSMARQLGKEFKKSWNPDKMFDKHEEYTKAIMLKKYSAEPYECLKNVPSEIRMIEHKGYVATLLDSPLLVMQEGEAMHHCVGSYSSRVEAGEYLVFSVSKDGKRSSTIAFSKPWSLGEKQPNWLFNQHYGYCNKPVESEDEQQIKDILLKALNKF